MRLPELRFRDARAARTVSCEPEAAATSQDRGKEDILRSATGRAVLLFLLGLVLHRGGHNLDKRHGWPLQFVVLVRRVVHPFGNLPENPLEMTFYLATRADKCDKWRDKTPINLKNIMPTPKNIMPGIMPGSFSWPHEIDLPASCQQVRFELAHRLAHRSEQVASKLRFTMVHFWFTMVHSPLKTA